MASDIRLVSATVAAPFVAETRPPPGAAVKRARPGALSCLASAASTRPCRRLLDIAAPRACVSLGEGGAPSCTAGSLSAQAVAPFPPCAVVAAALCAPNPMQLSGGSCFLSFFAQRRTQALKRCFGDAANRNHDSSAIQGPFFPTFQWQEKKPICLPMCSLFSEGVPHGTDSDMIVSACSSGRLRCHSSDQPDVAFPLALQVICIASLRMLPEATIS